MQMVVAQEMLLIRTEKFPQEGDICVDFPGKATI